MPKYNFSTQKQNQGLRLDKFLTQEIEDLSRAFIQKLIKDKKVVVNSKSAKCSYKLRIGDQIEIEYKKEQGKLKLNPKIKLNIIYENKDVIVINKPAGLVVHPANYEITDTLVNGLLSYYPKIRSVGEDKLRPGIVHRLDKDTSGTLVIAKNNKAFQYIKSQFKNRKVQKTYIALVHGKVTPKIAQIEKPIARNKFNPLKMTVLKTQISNSSLKYALTKYKVLQYINNYSLLEVYPKTGRMHQIRVHLSSIGHPVVGDEKYSSKFKVPERRIYGAGKSSKLRLDRQFLHASKLNIKLPDGTHAEFEAKLPKDLQNFLNKLTINNQQLTITHYARNSN